MYNQCPLSWTTPRRSPKFKTAFLCWALTVSALQATLSQQTKPFLTVVQKEGVTSISALHYCGYTESLLLCPLCCPYHWEMQAVLVLLAQDKYALHMHNRECLALQSYALPSSYVDILRTHMHPSVFMQCAMLSNCNLSICSLLFMLTISHIFRSAYEEGLSFIIMSQL